MRHKMFFSAFVFACIIMKGSAGSSLEAKAAEAEKVNQRNYCIHEPAKIQARFCREKESVTVRWSPVRNADYYQVYVYDDHRQKYRLAGKTRGNKCDVKGLQTGREYEFKVKAGKGIWKKGKYGRLSKRASEIFPEEGKSTLLNFLKTAILPIGDTMYIWGGGWNEEDTAAGDDAKRIGVNPNWAEFAAKQDSSYDFNKTRYQWGNGLDCSGYVGWTVYNILNTETGNTGYVYGSRKIVDEYTALGFGEKTDRLEVKEHKPGDIMGSTCSDCAHVYIVIGQCRDGSIVIAHSAPPGVKLSGTPSKDGNADSQAKKLAEKYMKTYYPGWYQRYPDCSVDSLFLNHYSRMRWDYSGKKVMWDPEGIRYMEAEEVLNLLYDDKK